LDFDAEVKEKKMIGLVIQNEAYIDGKKRKGNCLKFQICQILNKEEKEVI
jgi:hypothetical protein